MDAISTSEIITFDGFSVKVPRLQSNQEDTLSSNVLFEKPSWVPDEEAISCTNCKLKFSPLRRKHHCRNCGKIFCSRCCGEKVCLPQYGMKDPQKVCSSCKITSDLIGKSYSDLKYLKNEAAIGLSKLVANTGDLCKLIECGGLHILLALAMDGDDSVKATVAAALHHVAQHMALNPFLVKAGCLQVLKRILVSYSQDEYQIMYDSLSALYLLCQDENIKLEVLKEKIIDPLLVLLNGTGAVAALSSRILLLLIGKTNHMNFILQGHPNLPSSLLNCLKNEDFQMQEAITRILVHLTAENEYCRNTLLQEDEVNGSPLLFLLKGSVPAVLINSVCIVANLASSPNEQVPTHKYIAAFCELLDVVCEESVDLITHLGRGLANFSGYSTNSLFLVQKLHSIVSSLLKSNVDVHKLHACRIVVHLLSSEPSYTVHVLSSEGIVPFLETLFSVPGVADALSTILLRKVSRLSVRV